VLIAAAVWLLRSRRNGATFENEDDIGSNAQAAADALRQGDDVRETIQRCYIEICNILQRDQGIERSRSMTPTEFESLLTARGFPSQAVHNITQLFERTRYGDIQADNSSQHTAIESLEAIANVSREQRRQRDALAPPTVASMTGLRK
jgi:Domain of unknown function (DUF4129)